MKRHWFHHDETNIEYRLKRCGILFAVIEEQRGKNVRTGVKAG